MKFLEKIFSLTRERNQKVLTIFGLRIELLNKKRKIKYLDWMLEKNAQKVSDDFIPMTDRPINTKNINTKLIAFYLPQFHSIPLNDKSFGIGFTEWTNVTKAIPHFIGHNQPHLPYDVGFYDLSKPDVMYRQIELAKMYGIYGFCFHYYWFSGKRLLEKPIFNYLENKDLDLPFCFCWANENWAKLWDGGNKEVIMEQKLENDDGIKFINDIIEFFKDDRYIKINNKPLLIIYRALLFDKDKLKKFISQLKSEIKKHGFEDIYLCAGRIFNKEDEEIFIKNDYDFDALVEFPPHYYFFQNKAQTKKMNVYVNSNFNGKIFDFGKWLKKKEYLEPVPYKVFKAVFPNWDNTARKAYSNAYVLQSSPQEYKSWLTDVVNWTKINQKPDEQFVFINAWNEWGEGAHLEPSQKYGYAYLQATKESLEENYE